MIPKIILSLVIVVGFSSVSAAQDSHSTYPFSVPCPVALTSPGELVTLTAEFQGGHTGERYSPTYNWTVSAGEIVSGQGTSSVTLKTPTREAITDSVTVTLTRTFREAHYPSVQQDASCVVNVTRPPQPRMIDEFRTAGSNCEEGFARLDSFLIELNNNPTGQGVIVLYNDLQDRRAARSREIQLRNHLVFRSFGQDRVTFIRGAATEQGKTQFWLVPPGADGPKVRAPNHTSSQQPTAPYLYAANYIDGVAGCTGNLYDVTAYAEELKSLRRSRGRVVISQTSRAKYRRELNEILKQLRSNGISADRVTAIYKYVRPNRTLEANELWILPAKK